MHAHMHTYICTLIHPYIHTDTPVCLTAYIPKYIYRSMDNCACTHTYIHAFTHACLAAHLHTKTDICTFMHIFLHTSIHMYRIMDMCVTLTHASYIQAYITKYVYTYLHTYMETCACLLQTYRHSCLSTNMYANIHTYISAWKPIQF